MVMDKRRKTPKTTKLCLASAGRSGQRMTKRVLPFCFLFAALQSYLPGELPPPRSQPPASSPELSPTAMALPGLCAWRAGHWALGTPHPSSHTPSSLQCIKAFLRSSSSKLPPSCLHRTREPGVCCHPKTFCRASKHERNCAKMGMAAGSPISTQHLSLPPLFYWPPFTCFPHQRKPL